MFEILGKTNIDFMGKRYISFAISGLLALLGLLAVLQIARGAANLGIDFAGGTAVQLKFDQPIRIDEARRALETNGLQSAELQEFTQDNKLLVRVKASTTIEEKIAERVVAVFSKEFPGNKFVVDSSTEIGPTIGKKLQEDAMIAVLISFVGIVAYIAVRFELRFGVAAALATFHDVLAVLGVFYILDKEITLLVVTALLTLAGYSLTDTVVVFDRIRENLRSRRREDEETIINGAINQVLSRTIVTSLTVVIVLIPLVLAGAEVLHDFSLALLGGVMFGTYSSVFVASPLLLLWPGSSGNLMKRR
ncbi:protein translocase subunit SecF [Nitrospirales bacterium NOB]|nr:MAG: protein-export membrane protein SecF [Nitrospira sp. OLB3]MBV6470782.1 Protein translocase subunit SecF [Nitrospirota bacterium]MCK6499315.1 protein translocase subunit SecF [Nitrospira sp.]MDL1888221.1 protein translocase subunit SecF [Nitrospirales bacterium NOB]MEB2339459.1 protein translocase subunit SecF [Nitrospirales bacterium]